MQSKKDRATTSAEATAQNYNPLKKAYQNSAPKASIKFRELVANLLIGLQVRTLTERQYRCGWQLFEAVLRQYVDLKTCEGFDNG